MPRFMRALAIAVMATTVAAGAVAAAGPGPGFDWSADNLWGTFRYDVSATRTYPDGMVKTATGFVKYYKKSLDAPAVVTANSTVEVTYPDPNPNSPGCYTWKERQIIVGKSDALWSAYQNTGEPPKLAGFIGATGFSQTTTAWYTGGTDCGGPTTTTNTRLGGFVDGWDFPIEASHPADRVTYPAGYFMPDTFNEETWGGLPVTVEYSLGWALPSGCKKVYKLGSGDFLTVFCVARTQSVHSGVGIFEHVPNKPYVCKVPGLNKLSKACSVYRATAAAQWFKARWLLSDAARFDSCGLWIHDDASWRKPRIKAAERPDGMAISRINVGETVQVQKADGGTISVTCPG